jgi:hypothetical protein
MTGKSTADFFAIFTRFKDMLNKYASAKLVLQENQPDRCELIGPPNPLYRGKEVWFGAARIGKSYVSYHLMAVYVFPDLLDGISPELKKHMQGKSCFNLTRIDERLFQELDELTELGYRRYKEVGLLE